MFFNYLRRELRRRSKQAIVVALGLGIGIGLVITVSAASQGVKTAQGKVLHSLYGVGTDISVTKTASTPSGPTHFGGIGGFGGAARAGTTTTSKPAAGTKFSRTTLRPSFGQGTIRGSALTSIRALADVSGATEALTLEETSLSGTIPSFTNGSTPAAFRSAGSSFDISTVSVVGIQRSETGVGPLAPSDVTKGTYFSAGDTHAAVAIISSSYASQHDLHVRSTTTIDGKSFRVIGIASLPPSSDATDVFVPLAEAQHLAKMTGKVTNLYVSVTGASDVTAVAHQIHHVLPTATVTTAADLAKEVSGSITSASSLATNLGKWLSIAALLVAFLLAALLMAAAISRRTAELGTLKAIGWRTRRVVGQVIGEGVAQGAFGAIVGIVIGIVGIEAISILAPSLSATTGPSVTTGGGFAGGGGGFAGGGGGFAGGGGDAGSRFGAPGARHAPADLARTVQVHLSAPFQPEVMLVAIALALIGGTLAGAVGAWRAARLNPAAALRSVQ